MSPNISHCEIRRLKNCSDIIEEFDYESDFVLFEEVTAPPSSPNPSLDSLESVAIQDDYEFDDIRDHYRMFYTHFYDIDTLAHVHKVYVVYKIGLGKIRLCTECFVVQHELHVRNTLINSISRSEFKTYARQTFEVKQYCIGTDFL